MVTYDSTGPSPHPAHKMDGAHLMSSCSVFFPFVVQSVSPSLIDCILSTLKAITFLMSFSVLLITIVTVCLTNTSSSVLSLPLWEGRALPVFCECRAEEWRAEAEEKSLISSVHIRVGLHVSQHSVTHGILHALAPACFAFISSLPPAISKPQVRHLENNEHVTIDHLWKVWMT